MDGGTRAGAGLRAARLARGSHTHPGGRPRIKGWGTGNPKVRNSCGSAELEPRQERTRKAWHAVQWAQEPSKRRWAGKSDRKEAKGNLKTILL